VYLFWRTLVSFFGAGEQMAKLAEQGSNKSTVITSGIVSMLIIWSVYTFSANGLITKFATFKNRFNLEHLIYKARRVAGLLFINSPIDRSSKF